MAEAFDQKEEEEEEGWENEVDMLEREVLHIPTSINSWYNDLKYYLTHWEQSKSFGCSKEMIFEVKIFPISDDGWGLILTKLRQCFTQMLGK